MNYCWCLVYTRLAKDRYVIRGILYTLTYHHCNAYQALALQATNSRIRNPRYETSPNSFQFQEHFASPGQKNLWGLGEYPFPFKPYFAANGWTF